MKKKLIDLLDRLFLRNKNQACPDENRHVACRPELLDTCVNSAAQANYF